MKYYDDTMACTKCPLYKINKPVGFLDQGCGDEYAIWLTDGNPEPMIELLKKAYKEELKNAVHSKITGTAAT